MFACSAGTTQGGRKGESQVVPKPSEIVDKRILPGEAFLGSVRSGQGNCSIGYSCQVPLERSRTHYGKWWWFRLKPSAPAFSELQDDGREGTTENQNSVIPGSLGETRICDFALLGCK